MMFVPTLSRRAVLRAGLAAGAAALLQACGPSQTPPLTPQAPAPTSAIPPTTATISAARTAAVPNEAPAAGGQPALLAGQRPVGRGVTLPTRVPVPGPTPDLPGSADGLIDPGYIRYPASPFKAVVDAPGRGGDVTVATYTQLPPPTPMDSNPLWQEANRQLGVTLKLNLSPQPDYVSSRLTTIMAADDLPDVLYIAPQATLAGLPQFLQAKCADLTPYLSGDAVTEYPNLANLPTLAWRSVMFDQAIYGVPTPDPLFIMVQWGHQELLEQDALQEPRNLDEYTQLLMHFTNPQRDLYGMSAGGGTDYGMGDFYPGMYGLPNTWAVDASGQLTNVLEMPAYKDALNTARELWAAGVYSPNTPQYRGGGNGVNDFEARQFAFMLAAFPTAGPMLFSSLIQLDPPASYRVVGPFGASANITPTYWAGGPGAAPGARGYSVLKKASPERIKELLRVLNWIASPFGSQEYLLMHYGVKDIDYTLDDQGNPVLTQQGKADATIPWPQITAPPPALYMANHPEYAQVMQSAEQQLLPLAQIDPTSGLYSETFAVKGRVLRQMVSDAVGEVVLGRAPVSSIEQLVSDWRAQGGDQMRSEFEQAIAAAGS